MDAATAPETYRFGDFELDLGAHQLRLHGQPVRLERRPFELLALLVARRGRLVTREEIIERLWPPSVIIDFETGVNTLVRKVRQALGDSHDHPAFIETVAGVGYRFIAPITEEPETTRTPAEVPIEARRSFTRNRATLALIVLLAGGAILLLWQGAFNTPDDTRIVVLPFENLTGSDELAFLASGFAEETSASLAQIDLPDLAVIGGVSARALAGSERPLQEIGRELDIDFVVQSSLRRDQSRIRVTSRLIRIADSEQVWTASFDRELTNVLGLQRELSIAIAEQVRQRLSPDIAAAIDRRQTENPRAYELYLKGRHEWGQLSSASVRRALEYFEQAVAEDSRYALAWAGIADTLATSPMTVDANPNSTIETAHHALQRALAISPDLSEVQNARAAFHLFAEWDYEAAEMAARNAVNLDPNSGMAHMRLGIVLAQRDNHVEARAMLRRARELDPLFPLMFANSAVVATSEGDYQAAIEFAKQAIAISPEFWVGYLHLGYSQLGLGDYQSALESFSAMEKNSGGSAKTLSLRAFTLAQLGKEHEARSMLADLESRSAREYVPPYTIARVYAGLGEVDMAFEWLDRAVAERDVNLLGLANSISFESLKSDPRFASVLQQCGFVRESNTLSETSP